MSLSELDAAARHREVATGFSGIVAVVAEWEAPTPVDGWVARDVVAHLVDWSTGFLEAVGISLPGGPSVADDPAGAWSAHAASIQGLLDGSRADETITHPMTGEHRLADAIDRFYTADVFMHTWDLARSQGITPELDAAHAQLMLDGMVPIEDMMRRSGQYGPAVEVPAGADAVTRLMGFIGRDPAWAPRV